MKMIIQADDYGITRAVADGIVACGKQGIPHRRHDSLRPQHCGRNATRRLHCRNQETERFPAPCHR